MIRQGGRGELATAPQGQYQANVSADSQVPLGTGELPKFGQGKNPEKPGFFLGIFA
jgi:hypothetical protein